MREIVVNPHTGRWYTVGDNGAEFVDIPKNAIVFNHKQTESLLERGFVTSRGSALAGGNAKVWSDPLDNPILNSYIKGVTDGSKGGSGNNNNGGSSSTEQAAQDLFDWIEVRISRLTTSIDNYLKKAELATDVKGKLANFSDAQTVVKALIKDAQDGAKKYRDYADSLPLAENIKNLVKLGEIDLTKYSEQQQKQIQDYQTWYEKYINLEGQVLDLQQQQKDIEQQRLDAIADIYETEQTYRKAISDRSNSLIELYKAQGKVVNGAETKSQINDQINQQNFVTQSIQEEMKTYLAEMKNAKKIFGEDSTEYTNARTKYQELSTALNESKKASLEFSKQLYSVDVSRIDFAINKISDFAKRLGDILNYKIARNGQSSVKAEDYTSQIHANNQAIEQWNARREVLLEEQKEFKYKEGSDEYERIRSELEKCNSEIITLATNNEALKDSIIELRWKPFNELQKSISASIEEMDYLQQFFKEESFFDENGKMTDNALTSIRLTGEAMAMQQQTITNYRKALEKLEKMKKSGAINQDEYNEKSEEFLGIIRNSVSAVESYKSSLIDLYKKQMQEEMNVIQKDIDLRRKSLAAKKEYFDFDRKLKDKTKSVQLIEAEIHALENVDSAASRSRLAKLRSDLADAQTDLDDTLRDHEYDLTIKGYDDLSDNLNEELEKHLKNIDLSAEKQNEIVDSMLAKMESSYETSYKNINGIIESTGLVITTTTSKAIEDINSLGFEGANALKDAAQQLGEAVDAINNIKTATINVFNDGKGGDTSEIVKAITNATTIAQQISEYIQANTDKLKNTAKSAVGTTGDKQSAKSGQVTSKNTEPKVESKTDNKTLTASSVKAGDKVRFKSGKYTEVSDGTGASGSYGLGEQMYIIKVVAGVKNPYLIGTSTSINDGLGWVSLDQLEKYAKGKMKITNGQWAWTQEEGRELIISPSRNAMLTKLNAGDGVINADMTRNLMEWGKLNPEMLTRYMKQPGVNTLGKYSDVIKTSSDANPVYNFNYSINVAGNLDNNTLPKLKSILEQSYEYTTKMMAKDARKNGLKV